MSDEEIIIENFQSLKQYMNMKESELSVEWYVYSDLGPSWIGSWREVNFFVDGICLVENSFVERLQKYVIDAANIPSKSVDETIHGEGDISISSDTLEIKYWWDKAIPYQDPIETGSGSAVVCSISELE